MDWYFTAHPPIMHDLHEAQALMYTYSGAAPQNPNLDPILFAELPWFSNFELAQMTKWGMPGVYTHAFMDGWSPGYLGSVSYNHNGMMRMYETQSGSEAGAGRGAGGGRRGAVRRAAAPADGGGAGAPAGVAGVSAPPAAAEASRANGIAASHPAVAARVFRAATKPTTCRPGVLSALQLTASFRTLWWRLLSEDEELLESGRADPPYGFVIPIPART